MENNIANAFITGSQAYGTPTTESDIDLVVMMNHDDMLSLCSMINGTAQVEEYGDGQTTIRVGQLNLIICYEDKGLNGGTKRFNNWKTGTDILVKRKPVTRPEAIEVFKALFEKEKENAC